MITNIKLPKAPLKWAGGKARMSTLILEKMELFPKSKRFVDLFAGAGTVAIFASERFDQILFNDLNDELINLYEVIRDKPQELIKALRAHQSKHSKEYYYQVRAWDRENNKKMLNLVQRAARTIYMNKTGFNGLYRVNSLGFFNVPFGNPIFKVDEENLLSLSDLLIKKSFTFFRLDFEAMLSQLRKGDLVYIDPPYDDLENDTFNGYTKEQFGRVEQHRLKLFIDQLTLKGIGVIYSNHSTKYIHELFKEYITTNDVYEVQRAISANGRLRKKVDELLITNAGQLKNEN
jgi:DNA adenine methylase